LDLLLSDLLSRRTYFEQIRNKITLVEIRDAKKRELYKDISNYYEVNLTDKLDIEVFKKGYTKQTEVIELLCETTEYKKQLLIQNDQAFDKMIVPFKEYQVQLEISTLIKKITSLTDENEINQYLRLIDQRRKQVKGI